MDDFTMKLNSPLTEEQWDMLTDVDFDHTPSVTFHTKHGKDVEFVKVVRMPVKGYEGFYEVDNLARVFSIKRSVTVNDNGRVYDKPVQERKMRQSMHTKGYKTVALTKNGVTKTCFVHRIVAEAFVDNPSNLPMVNHKDEDKTNNLPENLEWCDNRYNVMYGNGRAKRARKIKGVPHTTEHNAKISESLKRHYRNNDTNPC